MQPKDYSARKGYAAKRLFSSAMGPKYDGAHGPHPKTPPTMAESSKRCIKRASVLKSSRLLISGSKVRTKCASTIQINEAELRCRAEMRSRSDASWSSRKAARGVPITSRSTSGRKRARLIPGAVAKEPIVLRWLRRCRWGTVIMKRDRSVAATSDRTIGRSLSLLGVESKKAWSAFTL